jgi:hypothetical protein
MSAQPRVIIGAGLAGLLAAQAWPAAKVFEAAPGPAAMHAALLRFRSDAVARLTGVEFRKVRVHKGIWADGAYVAPDVRVANLYARKVAGRLAGDRSIWSIEPVDRYVAPETLYEQLVEAAGPRILWGIGASFTELREPAVSTAPLPAALAALDIPCEHPFERAGITVERWRLPGADVFQTVYFPDHDTPVYRASMTGDLLIVESVTQEHSETEASLSRLDNARLVTAALGLNIDALEQLDTSHQRFGKIVPLPDAVRKRLLFRLTHEHGIYSLGRFATWRNILLDDVVGDIAVIKRLANAGGTYAARLHAS